MGIERWYFSILVVLRIIWSFSGFKGNLYYFTRFGSFFFFFFLGGGFKGILCILEAF